MATLQNKLSLGTVHRVAICGLLTQIQIMGYISHRHPHSLIGWFTKVETEFKIIEENKAIGTPLLKMFVYCDEELTLRT